MADHMDSRLIVTMDGIDGSFEYRDLEAAETLISMSFWCQRSNEHKPLPLTFTDTSCDSHEPLPEGSPDMPKFSPGSFSSFATDYDVKHMTYSAMQSNGEAERALETVQSFLDYAVTPLRAKIRMGRKLHSPLPVSPTQLKPQRHTRQTPYPRRKVKSPGWLNDYVV